MGKQNLNIPTLAAARSYTKQSLIGIGALKGSAATVDSIVPITTPTGTTGNRVTFKWTANDGVTTQTATMDVMDGISITNVVIDPTNNHLKITLSDGTVEDCGEIPSPEPVQVKTMPAANAQNEGKVVQYIGATNANYTHNYFYECVEDTSTSPSTYKWENVNVQEGGGTADNIFTGTLSEWNSVLDKTKYTIANITDD